MSILLPKNVQTDFFKECLIHITIILSIYIILNSCISFKFWHQQATITYLVGIRCSTWYLLTPICSPNAIILPVNQVRLQCDYTKVKSIDTVDRANISLLPLLKYILIRLKSVITQAAESFPLFSPIDLKICLCRPL